VRDVLCALPLVPYAFWWHGITILLFQRLRICYQGPLAPTLQGITANLPSCSFLHITSCVATLCSWPYVRARSCLSQHIYD
jgi:hypothetical protein